MSSWHDLLRIRIAKISPREVRGSRSQISFHNFNSIESQERNEKQKFATHISAEMHFIPRLRRRMQKQHDLSGESVEWKCTPFLPFSCPPYLQQQEIHPVSDLGGSELRDSALDTAPSLAPSLAS